MVTHNAAMPKTLSDLVVDLEADAPAVWLDNEDDVGLDVGDFVEVNAIVGLVLGK